MACGSAGYSLCVSEHSNDANADPANIIITIIVYVVCSPSCRLQNITFPFKSDESLSAITLHPASGEEFSLSVQVLDEVMNIRTKVISIKAGFVCFCHGFVSFHGDSAKLMHALKLFT